MSESFSLDTAELVRILLESVLYGIFFVLFVCNVYVLFYKPKALRPNLGLIFVSVVMFLFGTTHLALSFSQVVDGFVLYNETPGSSTYFDQPWNWKTVVQALLLAVYSVFADIVLIYRCRIVWSGHYMILVLPVFLCLGCIALIPLTTIDMLSGRNEGLGFETAPIVSFTVLTLALNAIVTGLIVWKIRRTPHTAPKQDHDRLSHVMRLLLESGGLYCATLFIFLMTYVSGSNALYVVYGSISPMIGITFSLLIARVRLDLTSEAPDSSAASPYSSGRSSESNVIEISQYTAVHVVEPQENSTVELGIPVGNQSPGADELVIPGSRAPYW